MKKVKFAVAAVIASASTAVFAAAPITVADLAASVTFSDVALAILAVTGTIITLMVTWRGAQFVVRAVKSA